MLNVMGHNENLNKRKMSFPLGLGVDLPPS